MVKRLGELSILQSQAGVSRGVVASCISMTGFIYPASHYVRIYV